jgi:hypothetical protein
VEEEEKKNKKTMIFQEKERTTYKNVNMHILLTQTCYKADPSSHQGRCPMTNKITTVLTEAKIWS